MFSAARDWLLHLVDPVLLQTVQHRPGLGALLPHLQLQRPSALEHLQQQLEYRSGWMDIGSPPLFLLVSVLP